MTANGLGTSNGARTVPGPRAVNGWSGLADRLPRPRRQRRPALLVVGVLLIALCAVVSASLVARTDHTVAVLTLARPVAAGQVLSADDVRVAHVGGAGVSAIGAGSLAIVVGETATSSLPAGTLLVPGMVSRQSVPAAGSQVVAVSVKAGLVPAGAATGRDVSLIAVAASDGREAVPQGVLVRSARLVDVTNDPTSDSVLLSVVVSDANAPQVAQAAAAGQLAVTLLPVGE